MDLLCFPQLDIVQQEFIHELGLQQFEVVNAAFDGPGSWLATVEERRRKAAELEINLKLWAFDEQTQRYRCLSVALKMIQTGQREGVLKGTLVVLTVSCSTPPSWPRMIPK